ncbi:MAG: PEP/pyruvate-binding domain-containing protein, partial [bacterium]|nr:PEP/pyruvate-binding domain-containing protein [bacterium]
MKLRSIIRFLFVISLFTIFFAHAAFDQDEFNKAAAQFGNKTANLMELQKITVELNKKTSRRYAIPAFFGISHDEIRAHLNKVQHAEEQSVADCIDAQWEEIKKIQPYASTTLAPNAQPILKNIRDAIIAAFDPEKHLFIMQNEARQASLDQFISAVIKEKNLLMVRSTGREDSKELANAGGNESVSSVPPEIKAVTSAIGVVVESYFSEKSLGQRLLAKDTTVFDKKPFMPVLLQIMIGEQVGGAATLSGIPTSGVMFSQEAEGRTPGIAHIQATWGHNEGVVNGLVSVDSFYVGVTDFIHLIVRIKQHRLVTMLKNGKNILERKANPRTAQRIQCLTPQEIIDLRKGADAIVKYYNQGPYDIEFVLLHGVINWVQARPITHKDITPSYLKDEFVNQLEDTNKQGIYVIGAGGGKTHIIDSKSALIITDTIRDALSIFLKREDKEQIEAIIVGEVAPATSHEATTFRAEGVPVLYSADVGIPQAWAKKSHTILIDPQRELIALFSPSESFENPADAIENGWFAHPISKKVSVLAEFYKGKPKLEMFKEHNQGVETSQLINIIKNSANKTEVTNALQSILFRVAHAIKKQIETKIINPQLARQAQTVFENLTHSAYEIQQAFETWNTSAKIEQDKLARLYPIVFFEALIKQIPVPKEFINDYSISSLLKIELIEKRIIEKFALTETKWKEYLVQYAKAADVALTDQLKANWKRFVKGLETIPDEQQVPFSRMMFTIATLELMPLWLNVSFTQAHKENAGDTQKIVQVLLDEFNTSQAFLKKLQEKALQLNEINMENWGVPDKFTKQWQQFNADILNYFISDEFSKDLESASTLGKNGASAVMYKFIDTFDRSIKALEASKQKYSTINTLIDRFNSMLDPYFAVLEKWAHMKNISNKLGSLLYLPTFKTIDQYLKTIKELKENAPEDESTLNPSPNFNVAAAALGSKAMWVRSIGSGRKTLEDVFTLIHQNILVILGILIKNTGIQEISAPPLVEVLRELYSTADKVTKTKASLIGVKLDNSRLTYFYNKPLENHSSTLQIMYDIKSKTTILAVQFVGEARTRWDRIAIMGSIISEAMGLSFFKKPEVDKIKGIIEFAWNVLNENQARLVRYLERIFSESTIQSASLLRYLIEYREIEAVDAIKKAMKNTNLAFKLLGTDAFEVFIARGEAFDEAIKIAKLGTTYPPDTYTKRRAFSLFEQLVEKNQAFNEALEAAKRGVTDSDESIKLMVFGLFGKLVEKGQAFDEATEAAKIGIIDPNEFIRHMAFSVFEKLVEREKSLAEAIEAVKLGVIDSKEYIRRKTFTLLEKLMLLLETLITKGQAFDLATKAASLGITTPDKSMALRLFENLVVKGQAFNEATKAATIGMEGKFTGNALRLFENLVKKGQAFDEATKAAKLGLENSDENIKRKAFSLFEQLVEKGKAFDEATAVASLGITNPDISIRHISLRLFEKLF